MGPHLLFEPEDIRAPVEISLKHRSYTYFFSYKVSHQVVDACRWFAIQEIVRYVWFP